MLWIAEGGLFQPLWSEQILDEVERNLPKADERAWGDYSWAQEHLAGRALASKGIPAVDAPDEIAFMRFVPGVAQSSQVFHWFTTAATYVTVVRVSDNTWRVWGLGTAMPSAKEILDGRRLGRFGRIR